MGGGGQVFHGFGGDVINKIQTFDPLFLGGKGVTGQDTPAASSTAGMMPVRPDWQSNLDPATGNLKDQYKLNWGDNVTSDQRGLDAYRNMALGTGASPWAQEQLKSQALNEQGLNQAAKEQNASSGAQARSALASKYGLSSGANTSLARQQMKDQATSLQNVGFQGAQARAGIGAQDAANRQNFLQGLPGQDLAQANLAMQNKQGNLEVGEFNIGNTLNETQNKRAADLAAYNAQMQTYGAAKSADAMRNSGSGGGGKK